jgi:hypothetical protein
MTHTEMLEAYPKDLGGVDRTKLADCIQACARPARDLLASLG